MSDIDESRFDGFINGLHTAKAIIMSCDTLEQAKTLVSNSIESSKKLHKNLADLINMGRPRDDNTGTDKWTK